MNNLLHIEQLKEGKDFVQIKIELHGEPAAIATMLYASMRDRKDIALAVLAAADKYCEVKECNTGDLNILMKAVRLAFEG